MRIAVNAMILSPRDTGVGVWTRGLIRALGSLDCGHEFLVYHGRNCGPLPEPTGAGLRYVPVGVPNAVRPLRILWEQAVLPRRLLRDGIDVLHCPAYVRPVRARVPTVLTLHDLFALTHPHVCKRLNVLHYGLMLPPSIRRSTVIHCTSHWTQQALVERFPAAAERAAVIHPGVDDIFQPEKDGREDAVLDRFGCAEAPFLFLGNVEPKKNVAGLFRAYALLRRRHGTDRKLLLAGRRGWRSRDVPALIGELGLSDSVVRAGYLPRGELPVLYRACLALVFPSTVEGFGLPPLEAMACGTPVVCSEGSGLSESVGDAALTVPVGDVEALADAMHRIEESGGVRADLSRRGLARAAGFRWSDRARQFLRLYEQALGEGRGR